VTTETRVLSGRYRVDDLIGRGGMASVYRGYDQTLGRTVAIKILKADLAGDAAFRTRFRLEAQAASRMAHPTIVRVFDAGEDVEVGADGHERPVPYIVMELVHGRLLKDVVATGPVPIDDALRYVDGILEALEYSHRAGVVHRDIKPGNVMITDSGRIKVMDFGIARAVSDSSSTVAETTAIVGTAAYFSPEQAKGESVDARADLYSAGVVLYELLTGRPPFRGDTPVAVAYQHVSEAPLPPSEINDAVPRALDAVVLRALAKDPFQRPQDAAAFREDLDATIEGKEPTKRQMSALSNELYGPNPRQAAETARSLRQLSTDTTMRRTPWRTQACSRLRVPFTSTSYSKSRRLFLPGVTMDARCTTVSMPWRARACPMRGSRMSISSYTTPSRRSAGARMSCATTHSGRPWPA